MDHQASSMLTPFAPAVADWTARSMSRRVREAVAGDSRVMQILAGKITGSILIDPHPRHARERYWGVAPHPMLE
jgi:hypothetical protein